MKEKQKKRRKRLVAFLLVFTMVFTSFDVTAVATAVESTVEELATESVQETTAEEAPEGTTETAAETATEAVQETTAEEAPEGTTETGEEAEEVTEEKAAAEETGAEEELEVVRMEGEDPDPGWASQGSAGILAEIEEERGENTKTFLQDDGTFLVAQYAVPVHYADGNGEWKEIGYTLKEDSRDDTYATTEKAGERDRVKFSRKLKEGRTVSIKNSDHPISWGLSGAEKGKAVIVDCGSSENADGNGKFLIQDPEMHKVRYPDIFDHVDAEYYVTPDGVKEDIILKQAGTVNTFQTVYDTGGLEAVQKDSRTIELLDEGKTVYQISAPYMTDAAGSRSSSLSMQMEQTGKKEITVTLTADPEWLSSGERAYPVTVDPAVLTETTKDAIDSTFITSDLPSANYSEKFELLVGKESSEYGNCRTLVKMTMPELKAGDMIVSAKLNLVMHKADFYASSTPDLQINAYQITESWDVGTVTWNSRPSFDGTVLDYAWIGRDDIADKDYVKTFDVTEAAKAWYEGLSENNGIMIRSWTESGTYADTGVKGYFWPERYNEEDDLYPCMVLTYRNNKGLEDYWTYTALEAGTAGTAYINDYTGNLVFIHDDVATTGERMPLALQHVYNGHMHGTKYTMSWPTDGKGWKMNIQQTLQSSSKYGLSGTPLEKYPYAYEDGDGTVHFFYKKTEDGETRYYDEDGLGLELVISGNRKMITDKEDNVLTFGAKGTLLSMEDASGNKITISTAALEDGKDQAVKVTDGAGHVVTFAEKNSTYHYLEKVTDPSGRITAYQYTDSGHLIKITYPDGTYSTYAYDTDGALERAVSSDGSGLQFQYTSERLGKRVKKVVELGTDGTAGQTVSFDRSRYNTTVIRTNGKDGLPDTSDDLLHTYQFDNFGRTVATNDSTAGGLYYGGNLYTYTSGTVDSSGDNIKKINRVAGSAYSSKSIRNYLVNHSGEAEGDWTETQWINSTGTFTAGLTDSVRYFGRKAFRITATDIPDNGGAGYTQALSVDDLLPGSTYTYSGYIRTSGITRSNSVDAGYGACLAVRIQLADGTYERIYSDYVTGTTDTAVGEGWRRVSITFPIPEDAAGIRAYILLRNAEGTAYFDGLQMESGSSVNSYNMKVETYFDTKCTPLG